VTGLRLIDGGYAEAPADPDLEAYMVWARTLRGLSENTLRIRERVLARVGLIGGVSLREVTESHLRNWEALDVAGKAVETRRAYISHVRSFYRWLQQTHRIRDNPTSALTAPLVPKPLPHPIAEDDLTRAIAAARRKLRAMIVLGAYAGLRTMEIAQLQWQDITTTMDGRHVLHVRRGKGAKDRAIPVGQVVIDALAAHGARTRGPCFYGRDAHQITANAVSQTINAHLQRLGIDATAHKLRHRFATVAAPLVDNDLPLIAELCGWDSLETAKHYALPDPTRVGRLVAALDELAGANAAETPPAERPAFQPPTVSKRTAIDLVGPGSGSSARDTRVSGVARLPCGSLTHVGSNWVSNTIAIVALIASGVAIFYSRRATKAAVESALHAKRSADVAERQEQRDLEEAEETAVRWLLEPVDAVDQFYAIRLTNVGSRRAVGVRMTLPRDAQTIGIGPPEGEDMDPGVPRTVEIAAMGGLLQSVVKVEWQMRPDGRVYRWNHPFPY
jgi:site-specific recombinase XerD